jgi:hypothetical protein
VSNGSFEQILFSQNELFSGAADIDGNGDVDNLDLFALGPVLTSNNASLAARTAYDNLLLKRADINQDGFTTAADVAALTAGFGAQDDWLRDLNVDGLVDVDDVETMVTQLVRTSLADFNLDRRVDGKDFITWQLNAGATGARFDHGDATLNGIVDAADLAQWQTDLGVVGPIIPATAASGAVPEPAAWSLACLAAAAAARRGRYRTSACNSSSRFKHN